MSPKALCHHLCPKRLIRKVTHKSKSIVSCDATCHHRRLFTSCLGQLLSVVCKSSTSLNRNTINYSNYSTCSVVGAFDLSFSPTYECRDDDQNQEVSELHGDADHFTLPLCFVLMMKLLL